ncbi:hypothetical protein ABI059_15280, partial [Enterococcus faecium]
NWVVTAGLNSGDKVIAQGLANVKPNQAIKPVPANAPQTVKPPSPEQMKQAQEKGGAGGRGGR